MLRDLRYLLAYLGLVGLVFGLTSRRLPNGRYEPVLPAHSWSSEREIGRIMLYELTRHADHHFRSTRKYQGLRYFERSPELPTGYPAAILLALVPPLWFRVVNPRTVRFRKTLLGSPV